MKLVEEAAIIIYWILLVDTTGLFHLKVFAAVGVGLQCNCLVGVALVVESGFALSGLSQ